MTDLCELWWTKPNKLLLTPSTKKRLKKITANILCFFNDRERKNMLSLLIYMTTKTFLVLVQVQQNHELYKSEPFPNIFNSNSAIS